MITSKSVLETVIRQQQQKIVDTLNISVKMNYTDRNSPLRVSRRGVGKLEASKIDAYNYIEEKCNNYTLDNNICADGRERYVCCDKLKTRCKEKAKISMSW